MTIRFYLFSLLFLFQPLHGYGAAAEAPLAKRSKVAHESNVLLDGHTIPSLTPLKKIRLDLRKTISKKESNSYYLFTLHPSENQIDIRGYIPFIQELNVTAGRRAIDIAEPQKSRAPGKYCRQAQRSTQCEYQQNDAYLMQMLGYSTGYAVLQVTQYRGQYFLTGFGTLHAFQVWADAFTWAPSEEEEEDVGENTSPPDSAFGSETTEGKGAITSIQAWLAGLPVTKKVDLDWVTSEGETLWTRTEITSLAEVGVLFALGGGGKILAYLEVQAHIHGYAGIILASLSSAVGFYEHQQYQMIESPSALHYDKNRKKVRLMPYCHPFTSEIPEPGMEEEEAVTSKDISTFLVKKFL